MQKMKRTPYGYKAHDAFVHSLISKPGMPSGLRAPSVTSSAEHASRMLLRLLLLVLA